MAAIHLNNESFNRLIQGETPVLVDFWAPWCRYCVKIEAAYDEVADHHAGSIHVAKVHVDQEPQLAAQEQIEVIPTLVLYRNGKALGSIVAPSSRDMIEQFLQETLSAM